MVHLHKIHTKIVNCAVEGEKKNNKKTRKIILAISQNISNRSKNRIFRIEICCIVIPVFSFAKF